MRQGHEDLPASGRDVETQEYKERFCANCGNKLPGVTTPSDVDFCLYCRGRGQHATGQAPHHYMNDMPNWPPAPRRALTYKEWGELLERILESWGLTYEEMRWFFSVDGVAWETRSGAKAIVCHEDAHAVPWLALVRFHDDGTVAAIYESGETNLSYYSNRED